MALELVEKASQSFTPAGAKKTKSVFSGDMCGEEKATIWEAHPFDEMIDFSAYAPGEVVDVFDGKPVVRTVDGSLLVDRYECSKKIEAGDILE